jgi:integrase
LKAPGITQALHEVMLNEIQKSVCEGSPHPGVLGTLLIQAEHERARRFAPHQLRHAHAVELAHEGVPPVVIERQLDHSNLGITFVYLQGIDNAEIIEAVHARRAPMVPVHVKLGR